MANDIQVSYPTQYYQLRRRVSQEIKEVMETWMIRASTDNPATGQEIKEWVRELSVRSGLPTKSIIKQFVEISPKTQAWFQ
jgi:hypothetical protein